MATLLALRASTPALTAAISAFWQFNRSAAFLSSQLMIRRRRHGDAAVRKTAAPKNRTRLSPAAC
eukprot:762863-Hanusia_phi.AAC.3